MPLKTIRAGLYVPNTYYSVINSTPTFHTTLVIDNTIEKAAFVIRAPETGTISKVGFGTRTVTTGATVDVRVETVSTTSGDPSGSLFGTDTNASLAIADANDNTWFTVTLTAGAAVTKGDLLALVIANPAVSWGNMVISSFSLSVPAKFPYCDHFTTSWAKSTVSIPVMTLEYSDGSYYPVKGAVPFSGLGSTAYSTSSSPDVRGLRFKLPFPARITGAWMQGIIGGDADLKIIGTDGVTALATVSMDKDAKIDAFGGMYFQEFPTPVKIARNQFYRLVLEPTTTTNVTLYNFSVTSAAVMDALEGGQNFHYTSAKDPTGESSWTNTTTDRPNMGLILDQIHDGQISDYVPV